MFVASGPATTLACVHPLARPSASPSPPLLPPLQRCLPQRTAGSSRISSAALLHNTRITDYSLLPPLLDLKFGEVEGHHFSLLSSVSNVMLCQCVHKYCRWHQLSWNKMHFECSSAEMQFKPSANQMHNWFIQTGVKLDGVWCRRYSR